MYQKLLVLTFSVLLKGCSGQVLQFGECSPAETMRYFDYERFLGTWFEIERFPTWFEDHGHCAYKTIRSCNRRIEIEHVFIRDGIKFILHLNSTYNPGDEAVFEIQASSIDPIGIPLSVINTDYSNYAVMYGCRYNEELGMKYILAWILSRNTTLDPDLLRQAHMELNSVPHADIAHLQHVNQSPETCGYHWTAHVNAVNLTSDRQ